VNSPADAPWWLLGVTVVLLVIGFCLEFIGTNGNDPAGAIIVIFGFLFLVAFGIVNLRRQKANR
jgi:amino acid transporter